MMCPGTMVQFGIPRVVAGENATFGGDGDFLRSRGVEVVALDDERCKTLMGRFIAERPEAWAEDIAVQRGRAPARHRAEGRAQGPAARRAMKAPAADPGVA